MAACELANFTVVSTNFQTNGRGQQGSTWESEKGKNLMFSVFVDTSFLKVQDQFYLNCAVSLAIKEALQKLMIPKIQIKWPNDILSGRQKICGILIENLIRPGGTIHSIVGIGVNVNQLDFEQLQQASSLKKITGVTYSLDEVMSMIVNEIKLKIEELRAVSFEPLYEAYLSVLFRKNKPSTFVDAEGYTFPGFIQGVTTTGKLQVLLEDEILKEFGLKEVKLLY